MTRRTAIVTGASRGLGRAIALRLARDGAHVVASARDQAALSALVGEIEAAGGAASAIALDLRELQSPALLAERALADSGRIDIVVNNAGATRRGEFEDLSDEDFIDGFALKYFGAVRLTRAAWKALTIARGSMVYISGSGGRTPGRQFTIGGSVNAALLSFTKAMADVGLRDGVQVNCINPGTIRTGRFQSRLDALAAEMGGDAAAAERRYLQEQKITRIGEPEDIAAMVAFLVGEEGRQMHGALLDMDAGATKTI